VVSPGGIVALGDSRWRRDIRGVQWLHDTLTSTSQRLAVGAGLFWAMDAGQFVGLICGEENRYMYIHSMTLGTEGDRDSADTPKASQLFFHFFKLCGPRNGL
jgi:hypothetical protein